MTTVTHPQAQAIVCPCGHSDRMHVKGAAPQYAGCMVVVESATEHRRRRYCECNRSPAEALAATRERTQP